MMKMEETRGGRGHLLMDTADSSPLPAGSMAAPLHLVQSEVSAHGALEAAGCGLSFSINGRLVPPPPGGGSTKLTLRGLPGGSASGFTWVQTPVPVKPLSSPGPAGSAPAPTGGHTPIITGVVSGPEAHRVLSGSQVHLKSSPPAEAPSHTPQGPDSAPTTKPRLQKAAAPRHKLLRKGELPPPRCSVCSSHFRLISELRGFLCPCSSAISQSLKELRKRRRSRAVRKSKEEKKASRRSQAVEEWPAKVVSPFTSPAHYSPTLSPKRRGQVVAPPSDPPPQGKLVILVEDFYYGSAPGHTPTQPSRTLGRAFHCTRCPETLHSNVSLMTHTLQHQQPASTCPHCLRHFFSPFKLQQHVEQVHDCKASASCRICELAFDSEPDFLWHMRSCHKPGEMPYSCQVCGFRSSFYSDVWTHFQSAHGNTGDLLCPFCLRVLQRTSCYQQHLAQHQTKRPFSCEKCRLHFLYIRELLEHKASKHTTHVKPPQLSGLRPGTKVTVRTYSVVGGVSPCKVVDVPSPPPPQRPAKRRRVESLRQLLWSVGPDRASLRCTECLSSVSEVKGHFPSVVTCSLCAFSTCCSASYATHMLSHHLACRGQQRPAQPSLFTPGPRLSQALQCVSCALCTHRGDVMAAHLMEQQQHTCMVVTHKDTHSGVCVCVEDSDTAQRLTHTPAASDDGNNHDAIDNSDSVTSLPVRTRAFVPVQLGPAPLGSVQLSVKPLPLAPPPAPPPPPAMTIRVGGPRRWDPDQPELRPLSRAQLAVVLSSLCHGVLQAALRSRLSPETVRSWTERQRRSLLHSKCLSGTDEMTEVVLRHRETQMRLDEDVLLRIARTAMDKERQTEEGQTEEGQDGETNEGHEQDGQTNEGQTNGVLGGQTKDTQDRETSEGQDRETNEGQMETTAPEREDEELLSCYNWTVDFMLRRGLGLDGPPRTLTRTLRTSSRAFVHTLSSEIQAGRLPPQAVACLDEFPVFVDQQRYRERDRLALQFCAAGGEPPLLDVVLAALRDGTLLPPLLCFSGFPVPVPPGFPDNVVLEGRPHGFTPQDRLSVWVQKVWRRHVASRVQGPSILILDPHRGHQNLQFRSSLSRWSTTVHYVPPGCCSSLQPLDVCLAPVLRDFLQARWTQLVTDGGLEGLGLDQLALTLACWVSEISSALTSETHFLSRSFSSVLDLQTIHDPAEADQMIADLTRAVVQPLETREPGEGARPGPGLGPEPGPGVQVLQEVPAETELVPGGPSAPPRGDSDSESLHGFLQD